MGIKFSGELPKGPLKILQSVVNENKDKTVFFRSEFRLTFVENTDFFYFLINESVLFLI